MRASACLIRTVLGATWAILLAASASAQEASRPTILKGMPAPRPDPQAAIERPAPIFEAAAGEDLWLIDAAVGELVACRLLKTSTVGRRVIRCFKEDLPARFRH